jgi:hypothetical protein
VYFQLDQSRAFNGSRSNVGASLEGMELLVLLHSPLRRRLRVCNSQNWIWDLFGGPAQRKGSC